MKRVTILIALLLAIFAVPAAADENGTFNPARCVELSQQYNANRDSMTFGQLDELRNCITTLADMKKSQRDADKADRAIIKLYGLDKG